MSDTTYAQHASNRAFKRVLVINSKKPSLRVEKRPIDVGTTPEEAPEEAPEETPEVIPGAITEETPETITEETPETTSEETPETTTEETPATAAKENSVRILEQAPESQVIAETPSNGTWKTFLLIKSNPPSIKTEKRFVPA